MAPKMNIFQRLYHKDLQKVYKEFKKSNGGRILDNVIGDIPDLQDYFEMLKRETSPKSKILISYHNPVWEPILDLASSLGLRKKLGTQNWLDQEDLKNILQLSGFEVINSKNRFFGITAITIAKPKPEKETINHEYSVSIIVPTRNEAGNIAKIIPSIPKFGKFQEIIFVEGNSKDDTWLKIQEELSKKHSNNILVKAYKQSGKGKADAVRLGFEKASGDILMIYDADRTVNAKDLSKFYNVIASGKARFVNGSRLVYPMEHDAMRTLNKIGNKMFSLLFSWILKTRFKDTLCGTKAMLRLDFVKYKKDYARYLKADPFGDFALIFTAIKNNLKIVEIPVRYKERVYGSTNINRFRHGILLAKMTLTAFGEFKL
jgi:hypothetical protein